MCNTGHRLTMYITVIYIFFCFIGYKIWQSCSGLLVDMTKSIARSLSWVNRSVYRTGTVVRSLTRLMWNLKRKKENKNPRNRYSARQPPCQPWMKHSNLMSTARARTRAAATSHSILRSSTIQLCPIDRNFKQPFLVRSPSLLINLLLLTDRVIKFNEIIIIIRYRSLGIHPNSDNNSCIDVTKLMKFLKFFFSDFLKLMN